MSTSTVVKGKLRDRNNIKACQKKKFFYNKIESFECLTVELYPIFST